MLNRQIRVRQTQGLEAAVLAAGADREQREVSTRIRAMVKSMQTEENRLLGMRREVNRRTASNLEQALTALIIAIAALLLVILFKIRNDLRREKRAKEQLRTFNKELEEQVILQTAGLQSSEEKYRTIFYKSPLPKWIYDVDTLRFIEVNDASLTANMAIPRKRFQSMKLSDLLPQEDLGRLSETMSEIRSGNTDEPRHSYWRQMKKNGEVMYAEFTTHPLEYDHRNMPGW